MEDQVPLIRYGWLRALLYFAAIFLIMFFLQSLGAELIKVLGAASQENGEENIQNFGVFYGLMAVCIFLLTFLMRRFIDRRSFESLGFKWKGFADEAALGFFGAAALLGIGSLILASLGYVTFLSITTNTQPLLIELFIMVVVAFTEEVLFRGYLLNNLMQSMNKWIALIISALLFALVHGSNPDISIIAIVNIFLAGIFLGLNYIFTKNLWFSIFFHFAWNFLQGPVYGYDVSGLNLESLFQQLLTGPALWTGGAFGFEGSVLCPIMFSLSIAGLAYGFERKYRTVNK